MKAKNDLYDYPYLKIIQNTEAFKFSLDSILLAEFVDLKLTTKHIVDFCCGNAPIPMILSTKTNAQIVGFEYQKSICALAKESIKTNKLEKQILIINDDVKNVLNHYSNESFDIATCNPPYFKYNDNKSINQNIEKSIARHEIKINICDIIIIARRVLKSNGVLYLSHRPERLNEILELLKNNYFGIKKIQFIHYNKHKNAKIVLIKAMKNGEDDIQVPAPIFTEGLSSYQNIFEE